MRVSRSVQWGSLTGMRKVETPEQMTDEYRSTLLKIVYALASTEFASVEQHQRWINQGPTAEDRFIQAQIAADEAHQGFIDCRLLRQFGRDGEEMADRLLTLRMGQHPIAAFNVPMESWVDVVGFCFCMDLVACHHLRAMEDCSYAPLAREMTTMVGEEKFHASFGARRIKDLVSDARYQDLARAGPAEAQQTIDKWYPHALDTFGSAASRFSELAIAHGIRRWGNEELRQMWRKDIDPQIEKLRLKVPDAATGRLIH
ncbi:MAG: phenylacetate-CoA oxygenase subunit PaaI [Betaproteobacteria bacterium]|nr:phenylacetate-CoA oxygenase subunit PaaI [Betaproteobacteria bacterium]